MSRNLAAAIALFAITGLHDGANTQDTAKDYESAWFDVLESRLIGQGTLTVPDMTPDNGDCVFRFSISGTRHQ